MQRTFILTLTAGLMIAGATLLKIRRLNRARTTTRLIQIRKTPISQ